MRHPEIEPGRYAFTATYGDDRTVLHIEAPGVTVNIQIGLSDADGRAVTRVDLLPEDESRGGDREGRVWRQDGPRFTRLGPGESGLSERAR